MAHSLTTIDVHLECAIQTELVVSRTGVSPNRKEAISSISAQIECQKDTKGFSSSQLAQI